MNASDRQAPTPDVVAEARKRVCDRVDELADVLVATSHAIHAEPELNRSIAPYIRVESHEQTIRFFALHIVQ